MNDSGYGHGKQPIEIKGLTRNFGKKKALKVVYNQRVYEQRVTNPESVPDPSHNRRGHTTVYPGSCYAPVDG